MGTRSTFFWWTPRLRCHSTPWAHLLARDGWARPAAGDEHCHLMTQCVEAWLVADRHALREFYGAGFNKHALPAHINVEAVDKRDLDSGLSGPPEIHPRVAITRFITAQCCLLDSTPPLSGRKRRIAIDSSPPLLPALGRAFEGVWLTNPPAPVPYRWFFRIISLFWATFRDRANGIGTVTFPFRADTGRGIGLV